MNDNDILIARKTEGSCRTVKIDGEAADFERMKRRVDERRATEEAKRKEEADCARQRQMEKVAAEQAEFARRRKRVNLTFGLVLSVAALMALSWTGLMHTMVGMVFIAGAAAAFGWMLGKNK